MMRKMMKTVLMFAVTVATSATLPARADDAAFVSSPFRLDMRMENGRRVAEAVEIIQASAAWAGGSGDAVAKVRHTPPGGAAETLHTTTSAGTESFTWDALHSVTGDHVFVHTIWRGGAQVDTMSVTFTVPDPTLNAIRIFGPTNFFSGNTAQYTCMGYFSDDSGRQVIPTWSLAEPVAGVSVNSEGLLSADESSTAKAVTLRAVATLNGRTVTNELAVTVAAAYLTLGQRRLYLESVASEASVRVSCSGVWTAEASDEWLTVSDGAGAGDGIFLLSCGKNPSTEDRMATVTVQCGSLSQTLRVMQYAGEAEVRVTVTFDAQGGSATYAEHEYVAGERYGTLPYATKTGKVFGGWWTQTGGTGTRVVASSEVTLDVTALYAYWRDMTPADALDGALDWLDDGDAPWVIDETEKKEGSASMRSGSVARRKVSTIVTEVTGPGTLSFWWRTSCHDYDYLAFYDGDEWIDDISGETGWLHGEYTIEDAGTHYISWSYEKNTSAGAGRDCGWLDGVVWMPSYTAGEIASGMSVQSLTADHVAPAAWRAAYGLGDGSGDIDSDGDGMTDWEEYIAGSNPSDPGSKFTLDIEMDGDTPVLQPAPYLGEGQRDYVIEGKTNLTDKAWVTPVNSSHRFFRAKVNLK